MVMKVQEIFQRFFLLSKLVQLDENACSRQK